MAHRVTSGAAAATRKEAFLPSCPVCAGQQSAAFYGLKAAPVTNASVFATQEEASRCARGTIELCACDFCGLVFNRAFDPALAQIGARYESSQAASKHFSAYSRALASDWVKRLGLTGKTVLEIGSGSGEFCANCCAPA